jgi:3-hydroxyisobutyrate dehydrogenase
LQKGGSMSDSDLSVGWIGAGRMGAAMAVRLAKAGVAPRVWNRTHAKAEALADSGCAVADTIADLRDCDVVFTMVSGPADLEQVLLGEGGLLVDPRHLPGAVVDCSTVSIESSETVRQACADAGVDFLAAPVSGNGKVVASGNLSFVVSGPQQTYERVAHLLGHIGKSVTYVGDGDSARLVKICHNLMLGVVTQCLAEITVLAEKGGVSRAAFLEFLNASVMGSTFTRYKSPAFVHLDYTPTFTPVLLRKDFDLGLAAARTLDVPMPVAALTAQLVQAVVSGGRVNEDFAVLLDQQATASGLALEPEDVPVDDGLGGPPKTLAAGPADAPEPAPEPEPELAPEPEPVTEPVR